ncbi:MAG: ABC transporter ATP-binding protein [Planctomycetota bacterium]|nr:MAG: ABC transporter ATP-binding protein [Planctomycetota bacterium]
MSESPSSSPQPLLSVRGLCKRFPVRKGLLARQVAQVHAVEDFDLDVMPGSAVGLVGESGCGKTTVGRCMLRLLEPSAGSIRFRGIELTSLGAGALRRQRRHMQMIFQDPYASLNPRMSIAETLSEPLVAHGLMDHQAAREEAAQLLERVGLERLHLHRFPHEFSGGQRQRIGIARALALKPELIVCDEPVSALDVSVQAQVINLLRDLQRDYGMSYIFIAHDLAVVAHLCSHVAVMYLGEIVEYGSCENIYRSPLHPYTQALLSAIPAEEPGQGKQRIILQGDLPSPMQPPSSQRMCTRFPHHAAAFQGGTLRLHRAGPDHWVRAANLDALRELAEQGAAAWQ